MALRTNRRTKKVKRNPKVLQYIAPEAPRGEPEDAPRKEFALAEHANIFDHNRVKRRGEDGDTIMLTEAEANFYGNLGYLVTDIKFTDERDDKIRELERQVAELRSVNVEPPSEEDGDAADAGSDIEEPDAEAEEGTSSDASGAGHGDEPVSPKSDARKARVPRRRKQTNL